MTSLAAQSREWFGEQGPLSQTLQGYQPRDSQLRMVEAVAKAMQDRQHLIVEAGTGIGKSLAYLVPALLSGQKVIVSTGTKNLQEQLFHKDLPDLLQSLKQPRRVSLLKGRGNYLCRYRLELTQTEGRLKNKQQVRLLRDIRSWSAQTDSGDLAEVGDVNDGSPVWRMVTSTTDNCLSTDCAFYDDCDVFRARRKAQEADVVIINHHLLLADMALKERGFGDLLPVADAVVVDEAHQLPQTAAQFFGQRLSFYQIHDLLSDTRNAIKATARDMPELEAALLSLGKANESLLITLAGPAQRMDWHSPALESGFSNQLHKLREALVEVCEQVAVVSERSKELENCAERYGAVRGLLDALDSEDPEQVRWLERSPKSFILYLTPLDISQPFHDYRDSSRAGWIMTSATLTVNGEFKHFSRQLGMDDAETLALDSPFDYPHHAVLYAPDGMPNPNQPNFGDQLLEAAVPVIEAAGGGAFLLCTSLRAVDYLSAKLVQRIPQTVFFQGQDSRSRLLQAFAEDGNAVLVATSSFWEGVDVRGDALRLVIIDRLPFTPPDDPLLQSRERAIIEEGGNAFMQLQVPQAVISLKQGVGRLIRSEQDRGVVMICDPRLRSKPYGRIFLDSLPPMTRTAKLEVVQRFYQLQMAAKPEQEEVLQ